MRRRIIVSATIGAMLVGAGLFAPAQAARHSGNNSSASHRIVKGNFRPAKVKVAKASALKAYNKPVNAYTGSTCVIDLSAIADNTLLTSVSGCGLTIQISTTMDKRTVPGSWASWGSPPFTESATPALLWTSGVKKVTLTYSARGRTVGVEAEPEPFSVHTITATFRRSDGTKIGSISRDADGNAGALLYAGQSISTKKKDRVKSLTLKSDVDFAIAQLRVS